MIDASSSREPIRRVSSGIAGLDEILGGGFPAHRVHLVAGAPGTGKTTLALQFLLAGVERHEPVLYVTLAETIEEIRAVAESHGWDLSGVAVQELAPSEKSLQPEEQYTVFHPGEVELSEMTRAVRDEVERTKPARVVVDSLAELQLLARDPLRYRRQMLGLKQFFAGRHCTVLLLDNLHTEDGGMESIAHSVLHLQQLAPAYGIERRRLRVMKLRGSRYRGGYHDFVLHTGGLQVFPRLVALEHRDPVISGQIPSGVEELDRLLGGGLDRGTSTLLLGPVGVGKSALATQYAVTAAAHGERAAIYIFDEGVHTFLERSEGLGMRLRGHLDAGRITLQQLDPAQLSPGEFDHLVRQAVERDQARIVAIDSLNGYLNAMTEERAVLVQFHELLSYLRQQGVVTIFTVPQHGVLGERTSALRRQAGCARRSLSSRSGAAHTNTPSASSAWDPAFASVRRCALFRASWPVRPSISARRRRC